MRKNEKEFEFVVYEPVKRTNEDTYNESQEMKISKKYSGLYNRGKYFLYKNRQYMLLELFTSDTLHGSRIQRKYSQLEIHRRCPRTQRGLDSFSASEALRQAAAQVAG